MLKSGESSSSVALHFGIGKTTVRNIKKKWAELDRYEITLSFGSPVCLEKNVEKHSGEKLFAVNRGSQEIWAW